MRDDYNNVAIMRVFIHRSIKTRIETLDPIDGIACLVMFLYIDPLKQGLKQGSAKTSQIRRKFLYIDPLKQGLKLRIIRVKFNRYYSFYT